ncbi:MAG: VacJ family lipoprotein [Campylobacterota bacterium]|nr:VacJ family lipoprotein [Campylobacterota bacterium]
MKLFFILLIITNLILYADSELFDDFEEEFSSDVEKEIDPLSGYNNIMTNYNDKFYMNIYFPIVDKYTEAIPEDGRLSISNFFENIKFPIRFLNNIAQLKFTNAFEESSRFVINSTIGIAGLFDVADTSFDIKQHSEDFGQTLGFYGVGSGFHIVLPFLGPSNLRDSLSLIVDCQAHPTNYSLNLSQSIAYHSLYSINDSSFNAKTYKNFKEDAIELYPYLKNIYEQHRESEINK